MTREEALAELRAIRNQFDKVTNRIDQIAAVLLGEQAREELLPVYNCGHRHRNRREASECLTAGKTAAE